MSKFCGNGVGNPLVAGQQNPMAMLARLRQDPLGVLRQRGFNLPANMSDPAAILQHLLNSGQVTQQQVDQAKMMAQKLQFR